jgi:hypothetical protein
MRYLRSVHCATKSAIEDPGYSQSTSRRTTSGSTLYPPSSVRR